MNDDDTRVSRAEMIKRTVLAPVAIGAFSALAAQAEAAATMDPTAASYVTHPVGGKQCSGCSLYVPAKSNPMKSPGACTLVKGSISPSGYCKFYAPKAK